MLSREEIREGIEDTIGSWFLDHKDILKIAPQAAGAIIDYLHSQGVVLKVDREWLDKPDTEGWWWCKRPEKEAVPLYIHISGLYISFNETVTCGGLGGNVSMPIAHPKYEEAKWLKAGYVAVESLIREETND